MIPQVAKSRVWTMALRKNPQTATYNVRVSATTPSGSDTFTAYSLLRVTYDPQKQDQFFASGVGLADQYRTWVIYQMDLDNAGAPAPQKDYELVINGNTWVIESIDTAVMDQTFHCRCRLAR